MLNIFTYSPFGTFKVINVTSRTVDHLFLSQKSNFQQYQLELGQEDDIVRSKKVWQAVFSVMNCSYKFLDKSIPISGMFQNSTIDIFAKLYMKSSVNPDFVYPLEMPTFTILAPEALPYSEFSSYLLNIISTELFVYFIITIVAVMLLLGIVRYKTQDKIVFFESVADVLNLLMNDNCNVQYQQLHRIEVYVIVPLTFIGLVIINGILSNLQSHITRPFLQPQINTIEDIYRSVS